MGHLTSLRITVVVIVTAQVFRIQHSNAQLLKPDSLAGSLQLYSHSIPNIDSLSSPLPLLKKPVVSNFNLSAGASLGYLPLIDSSSLTSGYSKSYWVQVSSNLMGLPVDLSYSSANNIFLSDQTYNFHQFNFSFDCQEFMDNLKSEMIHQVSEGLKSKRDQLMSLHIEDSLKVYEALKDSLSSQNYVDHIYQLRMSEQALLDSIRNGGAYSTEVLDSIKRSLAHYEKLRASMQSLMRFQEKVSEFQNVIGVDSLSTEQGIEKIKSIANKDDLVKRARELGLQFDRSLVPLSFREVSFGTQLLVHSPLTFSNYFSKGFTTTFNDDKYIVRAVAVNNDIGFNNFQSVSDSMVFPSFFGQNVFLLGVGMGDLERDYSLVSASLVMDREKDEFNTLPAENKWLISYLQQFEISERTKLICEIGETILQNQVSDEGRNSLDRWITHAAASSSVNYELTKLNAIIALESSYIGEGYFTGGNPLFQPGTVNVAAGWKQELFHSSLVIDYKLNHSSFLGIENEGSRNWYHIAQVSYRLGRFGMLSFIISPYQFNYYIPELSSSSESRSNFIDLNASFNIPLGKKILFTNWNFSNYGYQGTFSDTVFSSTTRHISCNLMTSVGGHDIALVGSYFLPDHDDETSTLFINSVALTGTIVKNKLLSFSIGPKWLGFENYSDQAGGTASGSIFFGKHFLWNASIEKFLNIETAKTFYPSTILFTTDLIFKL